MVLAFFITLAILLTLDIFTPLKDYFFGKNGDMYFGYTVLIFFAIVMLLAMGFLYVLLTFPEPYGIVEYLPSI